MCLPPRLDDFACEDLLAVDLNDEAHAIFARARFNTVRKREVEDQQEKLVFGDRRQMDFITDPCGARRRPGMLEQRILFDSARAGGPPHFAGQGIACISGLERIEQIGHYFHERRVLRSEGAGGELDDDYTKQDSRFHSQAILLNREPCSK